MTAFMHLISFLGTGAFYVPVLLVVFWCVSPRAGARATIVLGLNGMINGLLKLAFHTPRPYWTDPGTKGLESDSTFGMPSGHSQNAMVAYGLLGAGLRRRAVWAGGVVMIVLIGISRVYLGVHSPGQVLAGWAIGAAILGSVLLLEPRVLPWWTRRPIAVQVLLALLLTLGLLGLWALGVRHLHGWRMPSPWAAAIVKAGGTVQPVTMRSGAMGAGTLFGGVAGVSWLAHRGWFEAGGALWPRLARLPVGLAGAGVILLAEKPAGHSVAALFVGSAVLGLWTAAGAPETFVRMGLADRGTRLLTRPGEITSAGPS
jgi:hypothetical protein